MVAGLTRDINNLTQRYDSETDPAADPDTDATGDSIEQSLTTVTPPNKMQHSLHAGVSSLTGGIGPRSSQQHSSFKRPVMGNRGLETRQSKRSQQPTPSSVTTNGNGGTPVLPAHPITVGALEVMNVKRVVNRYGTLPKVARIGAFLDSLEDSSSSNSSGGGTAAEAPVNGHTTSAGAARALPAVPALPTATSKAQQVPQQMIRSNSSGGVTMQNNAAASLNKLQRHRTTTEGTMMTFSSFRAAGSNSSPKRGGITQPALANLEFPPPPLEEFEALPPPPPPPAPESAVQAIQQHLHAQHSSSNDVSNTAPSVEEASSRFGVSLRKREPSTDSCSSLGTPPETSASAGAAATAAEEKGLNLKEKLITEIKSAGKPSDSSVGYSNGSVPVVVDPVAQLVTELAESMNLPKHSKLTNGNCNSNTNTSNANSSNNNNNFKAQLKKVEPKKLNAPIPKAEQPTNIIDFKAHLRKVDKVEQQQPKEQTVQQQQQQSPNANCNTARKEETKKFSAANQKTEIKIDVSNSNADADGGDTSTGTGTGTGNSSDGGKRRSTGSISSLKKLWEQPSGDYASTTIPQTMATSNGGASTAQLSPKYGLKAIQQPLANVTGNSKVFGNKPPPAAPPPPPPISSTPSTPQSKPAVAVAATTKLATTAIKTSLSTQLFTDAEGSSSSNEEQQQTRDQAELMTQSLYGDQYNNSNSHANVNININANSSSQQQPMPSNANNKLSSSSSNSQNKPAVPHKPTKLTIYATPIAKIAGIGVGGDNINSTQISRESILELVTLLEGSLKHPVNAISASQWLQLSDKLNILQNSCVVFAENESMPPHSKFHFRELVTRVETQSQHLRTAGSKNVQDNERLVGEVGQSLKQISNALHR